ncbi:hypothetical protein ACFX2I_019526 [Malus domestica]
MRGHMGTDLMRQEANWGCKPTRRLAPVVSGAVYRCSSFELESSVTQTQGCHNPTSWCHVMGRAMAWAISSEPRHENKSLNLGLGFNHKHPTEAGCTCWGRRSIVFWKMVLGAWPWVRRRANS